MAAFSRARSSRRTILNQDQRIRLDGVTLPLTQNDLCESAYDAGAIGFIAKFLVQTTLPHRRQSGSHYTRTDGRFTLRITDVGGAGLPFGSYPRLILIWMTSEAVRTASRGRGLHRWTGHRLGDGNRVKRLHPDVRRKRRALDREPRSYPAHLRCHSRRSVRRGNRRNQHSARRGSGLVRLCSSPVQRTARPALSAPPSQLFQPLKRREQP